MAAPLAAIGKAAVAVVKAVGTAVAKAGATVAETAGHVAGKVASAASTVVSKGGQLIGKAGQTAGSTTQGVASSVSQAASGVSQGAQAAQGVTSGPANTVGQAARPKVDLPRNIGSDNTSLQKTAENNENMRAPDTQEKEDSKEKPKRGNQQQGPSAPKVEALGSDRIGEMYREATEGKVEPLQPIDVNEAIGRVLGMVSGMGRPIKGKMDRMGTKLPGPDDNNLSAKANVRTQAPDRNQRLMAA